LWKSEACEKRQALLLLMCSGGSFAYSVAGTVKGKEQLESEKQPQ
jgi:hypothetical protein